MLPIPDLTGPTEPAHNGARKALPMVIAPQGCISHPDVADLFPTAYPPGRICFVMTFAGWHCVCVCVLKYMGREIDHFRHF